MATNQTPSFETEDPQRQPQAPATIPVGPLFPNREVVVAPETPAAPAVKPEEVGQAVPQRPRRQIVIEGEDDTPDPDRVEIEDPAPFGNS